MANDRRATGAVSPRAALACGVAAAAAAFAAPALVRWVGGGWLAATFGGAAPGHALAAGVAGAVLAGLTVGVVLASLRASQPVFLSAWVGTTLLRLAGLAVLVLLPTAGAGATPGLLVGYVAAVVLGSLLEVPLVLWGGARPAEVRA